MAFNFSTASKPEKGFTNNLLSFWLYFDFSVDQGNGMLQVNKGYFATFLASEGVTSGEEPDWEGTAYKLDGGSGVGELVLQHARLKERVLFESNTEFGKLHLFELDSTVSTNRPAWLDAGGWTATFTPPKFAHEDKRMFHQLSISSVDKCWVHWLACQSTNGTGTSSLTAVLPFVRPSVFATILAATTTDGNQPKHMPQLTVHSLYGQQKEVTKSWSHFHGDSAALPGAVSGYSMIALGAFQGIPLGELASWHLAGDDNARAIGDRLLPLVASSVKLGGHSRNLSSFTALDQAANVPTDKKNQPIEVLHLTGLASDKAVI